MWNFLVRTNVLRKALQLDVGTVKSDNRRRRCNSVVYTRQVRRGQIMSNTQTSAFSRRLKGAALMSLIWTLVNATGSYAWPGPNKIEVQGPLQILNTAPGIEPTALGTRQVMTNGMATTITSPIVTEYTWNNAVPRAAIRSTSQTIIYRNRPSSALR
jgi:hypothetical protein